MSKGTSPMQCQDFPSATWKLPFIVIGIPTSLLHAIPFRNGIFFLNLITVYTPCICDLTFYPGLEDFANWLIERCQLCRERDFPTVTWKLPSIVVDAPTSHLLETPFKNVFCIFFSVSNRTQCTYTIHM